VNNVVLEICVLVEIHCLRAAVSFHSITQRLVDAQVSELSNRVSEFML
jgi:hypothetical protein